MSYKTKQITTLNHHHLYIANKIDRIIDEENTNNPDKHLILSDMKITGENIECTDITKVEFIVFENINIRGKVATHTIGCKEYHYSQDWHGYRLNDNLNAFNLIKEKEEIYQHNIEELQKDI
jgi:hypothetical protein